MTSFDNFLTDRLSGTGFSTEDALASFLPLLEQTAQAQQQGKIAPLRGTTKLQVLSGRIYFANADLAEPSTDLEAIQKIVPAANRAVDIVSELEAEIDADLSVPAANLWVAEPGAAITRPVYLPGYVSWEQELGHHDSLTDGFCLGMILASLSCGLDFHKLEDLKEFVTYRSNLFARWPKLHPVIAKAIVRMTELKRDQRPGDLAALLASLENYREQDGGFDMDLARAGLSPDEETRGKRQVVLATLQKRLFEISRRNRLLHFRPTAQSVNLTWASVPLNCQVESIREKDLFIWNDSLRKHIAGNKRLPLDRYLRFEEAIYLPSVLDHIRREAQRDAAEFGFAQLRLVLGFLRWTNLKESPRDRFESPLVLLPVELVREKGVRDRYHLQSLSTSAEINPVIRHYFQQLYGLHLPPEIDLAEQDLAEFHASLSTMIARSEPGVELSLVDRPRIRVIHTKAKRRLDSYRKRARLMGQGVRQKGDVEYSYHPKNFEPLGQKLFERHIGPEEISPERMLAAEPSIWNSAGDRPSTSGEEWIDQKFHQLVRDEHQNPYVWEMDLCSLTLGNFRYRKMSLVRDYDEMRGDATEHPPFDAVFSLSPKPQLAEAPEIPREEQLIVLPCDPTQFSAIAQARDGRSYIIQGPPGTGKSQTITNLIADFIGQGKRVLFVCEKRAAIDVVHHRLKQIGLAPLCSLIHDSQADKKAFVMDLKETYEAFQKSSAKGLVKAKKDRDKVLEDLCQEWNALTQFAEKMTSVPEEAGVMMAQLLTRAVELRSERPELSPVEQERLPNSAAWNNQQAEIESFFTAMTDLEPNGILAKHPFRLLGHALAKSAHPIGDLTAFLDSAFRQLEKIRKTLNKAGVSQHDLKTWDDVLRLFQFLSNVVDLAKHRQLELVDDASELSHRWTGELQAHQLLMQQLHIAREACQHWRQRLPASEVNVALDQARRLEGKFVSYFKPAYWRLRSVMNRHYDFSAHAVKPAWSFVLELLQTEYNRLADCETNESRLRTEFHFEGDVEAFQWRCEQLRQSVSDQPGFLKDLLNQWKAETTGQSQIVELAEQRSLATELDELMARMLVHYQSLSLEQLHAELEGIQSQIDQLPEFVYCLNSLAQLPPKLEETLRTIPWKGVQLEAAMSAATLDRIYARDPDLKRFDDRDRARHRERLEMAHRKLQEVNAVFIREKAAHQFRENLGIANQSDTNLAPEQKAFKKVYNRGRKILEHEFGKQMRHKPIRDLATGDSGKVVRDLKPVWLMSPLSVADTLPLDPQFFDVILFDEASQITLEEAMPSVFRANQIIVVGDEMQLPPTSFFATKKTSDEESLWIEDEEGESVAYDLDGNSFLSHAARNLPSTMLGWHYRSRSESLISFSNAAFYQGRLLTVPEETLVSVTGDIVVSEVEQGTENICELLARPVSFHWMESGCYENRRNTPEAEYIAHLLRGLLLGDSGLTVGIVAFSEAQQDEIEQALKQLAAEDPEFAERLDAEWEREEDSQFAGLLVKNLENIQGDERDVIILSVCYGPNAEGKMRMNFGPINQSGGEKRLNVAFSRSKQHMAVVSSIRHHDITNDYNAGARALKNYLQYAESHSAGNAEAAQRILEELARGQTREIPGKEPPRHPVLDQLQNELEQRGYVVDRNVGQSQFRCHLAVYAEGDREYRLGILVDTEDWYRQTNPLEREVLRPRLLEAFGWQIALVLAKDWLANPSAVLASLEARLQEPKSLARS